MSYIDDQGQPTESFFRSANGSTKPDGTNDYTEAITHNGNLALAGTTDPTSPLTFNFQRFDTIRFRSTADPTNIFQFDGIGTGANLGLHFSGQSNAASFTFTGGDSPTSRKQYLQSSYRSTTVGDPREPIGVGHWRFFTSDDDGSLEFRTPNSLAGNQIQGRFFFNAFSGNGGICGTALQIQTALTTGPGQLTVDRYVINGDGDHIFTAATSPTGNTLASKAALVTMDGGLRIKGGARTNGGAGRVAGGLWFGADLSQTSGANVISSPTIGDADSGLTSVGDGDLTFYTNNTVSGRVSGLIWSKAGGGLWAALSDMRSKESVATYAKGLEELASLSPITYRYNALSGLVNPRDDENLVGFSAQELDVLFPECVDEMPVEGFPEGALIADVTPLIPALVNAVKELDARLAAVEKRESAVAKWEKKMVAAKKTAETRRTERGNRRKADREKRRTEREARRDRITDAPPLKSRDRS